MTNTTRATDGDDLILLALVGAWISLEAAATLAVALVALLLTVAGWRPSQAPLSRPAAPVALPVVITPALLPAAAVDPLEALPVRELRSLARAAGLSQLGRSGRRADLLAALAA
ncbi:MAG: hypothetical protein RLZZ631_84 [Cyanobacteriota bacterium]|jgi:hypothetical protein